jgi:hypothetical protein
MSASICTGNLQVKGGIFRSGRNRATHPGQSGEWRCAEFPGGPDDFGALKMANQVGGLAIVDNVSQAQRFAGAVDEHENPAGFQNRVQGDDRFGAIIEQHYHPLLPLQSRFDQLPGPQSGQVIQLAIGVGLIFTDQPLFFRQAGGVITQEFVKQHQLGHQLPFLLELRWSKTMV